MKDSYAKFSLALQSNIPLLSFSLYAQRSYLSELQASLTFGF